ncbi:uncharacterized protein BXZ73DRAFT_105063 [Epithele typhae]|uniref:uncharacterized protein n=1 Tax=Epithele typhae TaxID=378194 RepID=UPI002008A06A|nr:uncharacterized protein BXZ73DRAFT_105063 [Epithele typhae]KAH9918908.1 hypothetical protein BXZ73DRAFT_105063 [Epithele typhae]
MAINHSYALIHQNRYIQEGSKFHSHVQVVDLVSGEVRSRLANHSNVSKAVLRRGFERGDFTVLALTSAGGLVVDCGEEDSLGSSTPAHPALSPLHRFTPKALSADGTRALCFVGATGPSDTSAAAPQFCVVDTVTGGILSGPFGGEGPLEIIGEHYSLDITRATEGLFGPTYREGWFWSTLHGRLYRTPALDNSPSVGRVAVTYDGSMVVWSDRRGVVRFHRNGRELRRFGRRDAQAGRQAVRDRVGPGGRDGAARTSSGTAHGRTFAIVAAGFVEAAL